MRTPVPALITGATGFIGRRLAERLLAAGWPLRLLVRDPARLAPTLAGAAIVVGDLADGAALARAVAGVQVVFHCAANVRTWDARPAYLEANVAGVFRLVQAVARHNPRLARLVHLSTVDVYGYPALPCGEDGPQPAGGFGYGDSKRMGERLLRELGQLHGIPWTVLRPANVIGPRSQFVRRIGEALQSGVMLTVDGGRAHAGLLHVDNLVDHMVWAARAEAARQQCYNVRDPGEATWADFLAALGAGLGGRGRILNLPFAVADGVAAGLETFHRSFLPAREPLLHRLLVRIFGRTCGHPADKIVAHSGFAGAVGFDAAVAASVRWLREEGARTAPTT